MFNVYPQNPELENLSNYTIGLKTDYLLFYFEKFEKIFQEEVLLLNRQILAEDDRIRNYEDDSQYDFRPSDSLKEINFTYLRMHRYAVILAVYSFLENSMTKLCEKSQKEASISISVSDLKGNGIFQCHDYLTKLIGINFADVNTEWSQLVTLNKLRNCIVHTDGDLARFKSPQKLTKIIESSTDLSFIEQKLVMPSEQFTRASIINTKTVLMHISGLTLFPRIV
jgi:hypothetical protein